MASTIGKIISELDTVLGDMGVERRTASTALSSFGLFTAGVAIGAVASLLLAPKTGVEMRNDLTQRFNAWREDMESKMQTVMGQGGRYNPPS